MLAILDGGCRRGRDDPQMTQMYQIKPISICVRLRYLRMDFDLSRRGGRQTSLGVGG